MTVHEAALYLRLSEASIWRLLREGALEPLRIRRRTFLRRQTLDAFIEAQEGAAAAVRSP
jgi:excisionase family DNA binding protein